MIVGMADSLGMQVQDPAFWLPLACLAVLWALLIAGAILDGFDLGVGVLLPLAPPDTRQRLWAHLGAWRDANGAWLLLAAGLFASAFPAAWGQVMGRLYAPLTLVLLGGILRSVCFEFRYRARPADRARWLNGFWVGAVLSALGHGWVLGRIATAYQTGVTYLFFDLLCGLCALATYIVLAASWLSARLHGALQERAVNWARRMIPWSAAGMLAVAMTLGLLNGGVLHRWSNGGDWSAALAFWAAMLLCMIALDLSLTRRRGMKRSWTPCILTLLLLFLMLVGVAFSLFPYLILDEVTIWDGSADPGSQRLALAAAAVAVPVLLVISMMNYRSLFTRPSGSGEY